MPQEEYREQGFENPLIQKVKGLYSLRKDLINHFQDYARQEITTEPVAEFLYHNVYGNEILLEAYRGILSPFRLDREIKDRHKIGIKKDHWPEIAKNVDKTLYEAAQVYLLRNNIDKAVEICEVIEERPWLNLALDIAEAAMTSGKIDPDYKVLLITQAAGITANHKEKIGFYDLYDKDKNERLIENVRHNYRLAFLYQYLDRNEDAGEVMQKLEDIIIATNNSKSAEAYTELARGYAKLGNLTKAESSLVLAMRERQKNINLGTERSLTDYRLMLEIAYLLDKSDFKATNDFLSGLENLMGEKLDLQTGDKSEIISKINIWVINQAHKVERSDDKTKADFEKLIFSYPEYFLEHFRLMYIESPGAFKNPAKVLMLYHLYRKNGLTDAENLIYKYMNADGLTWETGVELIDTCTRILKKTLESEENRKQILEVDAADPEHILWGILYVFNYE